MILNKWSFVKIRGVLAALFHPWWCHQILRHYMCVACEQRYRISHVFTASQFYSFTYAFLKCQFILEQPLPFRTLLLPSVSTPSEKNIPLLALSFRMSIRSYITFASPGRFVVYDAPFICQRCGSSCCPHVAGYAQYMFFTYAAVCTCMCDICHQICYLKPDAMFLLKSL
jgi:hypothetical protein